MTRWKNYDSAAERASDKREAFEYVLGGETFVAPPETTAAAMLDFLRKSASDNSGEIADGVHAILGEDVWNLIYKPAPGAPLVGWESIRQLCNDLAVYYGGGIVGVPKAVMGDQATEPPQTMEESLPIGSEETSGSLTDGETLSDLEPVATASE